jgi:uncharacterized protein (TIGR01777 family)
MKIIIAGGTGFLGSPLAEGYAEEGHDVRVLTRGLTDGESRHDSGTGVPGVTRVGWRPEEPIGRWASALDGADAVINLTGANIGDKRWTPQRKALLYDSRIIPTRTLASAIAGAAAPPPVFISGSGVNYYGTAEGEPKTESSPAGDDFLAGLCEAWEAEAVRARNPATRVVLTRSGVVLERSGGALPRMMMPFRFFAGGPVGSGRQYMSWIHRIDWIEMIRWIVDTPAITGPVNVTAPVPVTSREFARALGHAMRRPALLPVPSLVLKSLFGEMASALLLAGQRAVPQQALSRGFHFRYPEIDLAFRGMFGE